MEKYYTITLKPDMTAVVHTHKTLDLELPFLQEQVGGYIEVVSAGLARNSSMASLRMIINEDGKYLNLPVNVLGTVLYDAPCDVIVGNVLICSTYNPDPDAEPDTYALCQSQYDVVMKWISSLVEKSHITEVAV